MNPPERLRWTDSRLDDRFETVVGELRVLKDIPDRVGRNEVRIDDQKEDVDRAFVAIRELGDGLKEYIAREQVRRETDQKERKSDRRWIIGTVLTSAGLIIAAMGILLSHVG